MKVVGVSNFDIETVDDILMMEDISTMEAAQQIADKFNEEHEDYHTYYYKAVNDDYVLHKWEP